MAYQNVTDNSPAKNQNKNFGIDVEKLTDTTKEIVHQATDTLKQSGTDWLEYVKKHPLQSMVYGVIIYFSIKGMIK